MLKQVQHDIFTIFPFATQSLDGGGREVGVINLFSEQFNGIIGKEWKIVNHSVIWALFFKPVEGSRIDLKNFSGNFFISTTLF
jgi:hypothetical protein